VTGSDRSVAGQPATSRTAIPPGTRDVLPEEMRELRAIGDGMRACFERAGYGEIHTPALEYEEVLRRGEERAAGARYRTFDEQGAVLALRSDMTIPIARVVATRYADAEPPLRFSYLARAWRATERGVGESREFLQGGMELIGVPGAEGEAEVVALAIAALDEAGLRRHRVGIGDGALYRKLLSSLGVSGDAHMPMLESLSRRDLVGLEHQVNALGLGEAERELLVRLPQIRGGREVLDGAAVGGPRRSGPAGSGPTGRGPTSAALEGLRGLHELLSERGVAGRVIFDLGLVRELGYYTGAVFEVYDPAVGFALGGGGRYDELIGRFGRDLPACGIALDVQRVHLAQAAEEALS
jgi:ATP phosphoribosyltransferase regulatory subunit